MFIKNRLISRLTDQIPQSTKAYAFDGIDDNVTSSPSVTVGAGDSMSFMAKLTPTSGVPRYFFRDSSALFFNLWAEGQVYREGCATKIDGVEYANWESAPTDGLVHEVEVNFTVAGSFPFLLADSDGVRAVDFQVYDMKITRSGVTETFPMGEGVGNLLGGDKGTVLTINNHNEEYWSNV